MKNDEIKKTYNFYIDRGGTFTDVVAVDNLGIETTLKLLSEDPQRYEDAALEGIRRVLNINGSAPIPTSAITSVKMGTTVATNALLERKGSKTLLITSKGMQDSLQIGYQDRPDIFAINVVLPAMLYNRSIAVEERIAFSGKVLVPLNEQQLEDVLKKNYEDGFRSVAIAFLHSYLFPANEQKAFAIANKIGYSQISLSCQVSPLIKYVYRGDTAVVDAYLSPILKKYIQKVVLGLGEGATKKLFFMTSSGGLVRSEFFAGKDAILSGPAGGVVGMVKTAEAAGFKHVVGFDMGGTSTDVAHYAGEYERKYEAKIAGVRMRTPMMNVHTIAAGGGSILKFEDNRLQVGPESAGANPGPACYGKGGPLTVTDANVLLGRVQAEYFPTVFGVNGDQPLQVQAAKAGFLNIQKFIVKQSNVEQPMELFTLEELAVGFLEIACEKMALAIKKISVERGYNLSKYTLNCFGGAGAQHACLVANKLGIENIFIHPHAGVLSAYGIGKALLRVLQEAQANVQLCEQSLETVKSSCLKLVKICEEKLVKQGAVLANLAFKRTLRLRYKGSDNTLEIPFFPFAKLTQKSTSNPVANNEQYLNNLSANLISKFKQLHLQQFGFVSEAEVFVESVIVEGVEDECTDSSEKLSNSSKVDSIEINNISPHNTVKMYIDGKWTSVPVFLREKLLPGSVISGAALVVEKTGTIVILKEWRAVVDAKCNLILKDTKSKKNKSLKTADLSLSSSTSGGLIANNTVSCDGNKVSNTTTVNPIKLEVFNSLYMSIAQQMGVVLAKTAFSVNIKERLDFSCALFNAKGELIANAPHVPVHLGSMGETIREVITSCSFAMQDGDVYMHNDPYAGGTHLPDVTVVTPVYIGGVLLFYVASRGHHADIGGRTPGSCPPNSTQLEEEGVLIKNFLLVRKGEFKQKEVLQLLKNAKYPARNPQNNIADLKAQIAANATGVHELKSMVQVYGLETVQAYMQHVQQNAEDSVRAVIGALKGGAYSSILDNGLKLQVEIDVDTKNRTATVNFTGTSGQHEGNYNAPHSITRAAVMYVFRMLCKKNIPLNEGCMVPIKIISPKGTFINPNSPAAVVAGNTEVSQVITNTLLAAVGVMAASQGTMNNFIYGNENFQNYETICGGVGASNYGGGACAVHSHMTNTRMTDPEVLEMRFPVRIDEFSIRKNSGGGGKHHGGNGVERLITFLEAMQVTTLTSSRKNAPFGLLGGKPGAKGENFLVRNGKKLPLDGNVQVNVEIGDAFLMKTPGGGGYLTEDNFSR